MKYYPRERKSTVRGRKVNVWRADTISTTAMQPCVSITLSPDVDADSTWVDTSCYSYHIIVNSKDIQQSMWYRIYHYKILYKVWIDDEEWNAWHVPYVSTSATKIYFLHIYSFFYIYSESLARAICVNKLNKKIMICASDASSACRSVGLNNDTRIRPKWLQNFYLGWHENIFAFFWFQYL